LLRTFSDTQLHEVHLAQQCLESRMAMQVPEQE